MAHTITIPLQVLTPGGGTGPGGSYVFGPYTVSASDHLAVLSIDRTVSDSGTNGLNGQPATTSLLFQAWYSPDGGTTWDLLVGTTFPGGTYTNPATGLLLTTDSVQSELAEYKGDLIQAQFTAVGAPVAIQGSLVVT